MNAIFGVNGSLQSKNWSIFENVKPNRTGSGSSYYLSVSATKVPDYVIYIVDESNTNWSTSMSSQTPYTTLLMPSRGWSCLYTPSQDSWYVSSGLVGTVSSRCTLSGSTLRIKSGSQWYSAIAYIVYLLYL